MSKFDPVLAYDYEDTPRFMAEMEIEKNIIKEEIERRMKNDCNE